VWKPGEEVTVDSNDDGAMLDPEIVALLHDPSLWEEPGAQLEDRVVSRIADERRVVVPMKRRNPWPGRLAAAAVGAAAAAAVVLVVTRDDQQQADATVAVTGSDLAPGISGTADITAVSSGVRIEFSVPGLPRRDGDEFYEGWLKNCAGTGLVPIGTYHDLENATGWAGVDVADFPLLTVTREVVAGPKDAEQGSSGEVVLSAAMKACPAT
jgi:hypothetical protein